MKSDEICGALHLLGASEKGQCVSDLGDVRKAQVRTIFDRLAPRYDAVGPACFDYFGRCLVDEVGMESGSVCLMSPAAMADKAGSTSPAAPGRARRASSALRRAAYTGGGAPGNREPNSAGCARSHIRPFKTGLDGFATSIERSSQFWQFADTV